MLKNILIFLFITLLSSQAYAKSDKNPEKSSLVDIPVFSQKIQFRITANWKVANQVKNKGTYVIDFIPKNENSNNFNNMFALIAFEKIGSGNIPLDNLVTLFVKEYEKQCPSNFTLINLGEVTTNGYPTARILSSCLSAELDAPTGLKKGQSEIIYTTIIRGKADVYAIKRMLRGKALTKETLPYNKNNAELFIRDFSPIKVCSLEGKAGECNQ